MCGVVVLAGNDGVVVGSVVAVANDANSAEGMVLE